MSPLSWAILLLAFGLGLIVLEMFVPSGGVIGFISLAAVVTSIIMAFRYSEYTGIGFLAGAVLGMPLLVALLFKWWPNTPLGRRILLTVPKEDDVLPDGDLRREMKALVGKLGTAKTMMLPGGPVAIEGRAYDALSEGPAIAAGDTVRVVEVRGTRIVVRPAAGEKPVERPPDDPLAQSIDKLGLDPYEDPLK
jgi:membrane-bound ClpP family serine protease